MSDAPVISSGASLPAWRLARKLLPLAVALAITFAAAALGSAFTTSGLESWYATLDTPAWNPPNWVFGPVWTVLYTAMAVAAWMVWRAGGRRLGHRAQRRDLAARLSRQAVT